MRRSNGGAAGTDRARDKGLWRRRRWGIQSRAAELLVGRWLRRPAIVPRAEVSLARLAEVERAAREYLGGDGDVIGRDELIAPHAQRRRRPRRRPAGRGVRGGHIEGARSITLEDLEDRLAYGAREEAPDRTAT